MRGSHALSHRGAEEGEEVSRDGEVGGEDAAEARVLSRIPSARRRDRVLFRLIFETGMRVGEALGLWSRY